MSKRQALMGVGGAIVCGCSVVMLVVRGLVGCGVLLYAVIEYYNISFDLESEHFSATSGGLYSLIVWWGLEMAEAETAPCTRWCW